MKKKGKYYSEYLTKVLHFLVEPDSRVLTLSLDTVPNVAHMFENEKFDYIILPNLLQDIHDVELFIASLHRISNAETRIVVINHNKLWNPMTHCLSVPDIKNIFYLEGFEVIKENNLMLCSVYVPLISAFLNAFLAKLPMLRRLGLLQILVMKPSPMKSGNDLSVSVIIPCKNEEGNIEAAIKRMPKLGHETEIVMVDDKSTDGTRNEILKWQSFFPDKNIKLVSGPGICKAEAVWTGFAAASGDILMILDADLTVMPEELPLFYRAIADGKGEFINGSRQVYPMDDQAMRPLNIIGNKFFSWTFSYLLGQRIKDTLCGTKVFSRKNFLRIKKYIGTWGTKDRWGDYDLLFGAAKLNLKIVDLPVHYKERIFGETKMNKRFKNGLIMLKMCYAALKKFKLHI